MNDKQLMDIYINDDWYWLMDFYEFKKKYRRAREDEQLRTRDADARDTQEQHDERNNRTD